MTKKTLIGLAMTGLVTLLSWSCSPSSQSPKPSETTQSCAARNAALSNGSCIPCATGQTANATTGLCESTGTTSLATDCSNRGGSWTGSTCNEIPSSCAKLPGKVIMPGGTTCTDIQSEDSCTKQSLIFNYPTKVCMTVAQDCANRGVAVAAAGNKCTETEASCQLQGGKHLDTLNPTLAQCVVTASTTTASASFSNNKACNGAQPVSAVCTTENGRNIYKLQCVAGGEYSTVDQIPCTMPTSATNSNDPLSTINNVVNSPYFQTAIGVINTLTNGNCPAPGSNQKYEWGCNGTTYVCYLSQQSTSGSTVVWNRVSQADNKCCGTAPTGTCQ